MKLAQGWHIMLADLSLILFLTTAAALASQEDPSPGAGAALLADATEPVAVFRAGEDADFARWLASRAGDPREVLTILARYRDRDRPAAVAAAEVLAGQADAGGLAARIVVEPGLRDETLALFAFADTGGMARDLQ